MRKGHIRCLPFWCLIPSFWCANGCFFLFTWFSEELHDEYSVEVFGGNVDELLNMADVYIQNSTLFCRQMRSRLLQALPRKGVSAKQWDVQIYLRSFIVIHKKADTLHGQPVRMISPVQDEGLCWNSRFSLRVWSISYVFFIFFGWLYPEVLVACYSSTLVASRPGHCPSHPSYHNAWNRTLVEALLTTSSTWSSEGFIAPCILFEQPWFETYYSLDVWCMYDLNTTFLKDEYIWERESLRHRHIPLRFFFFWFCSEVLLCPTKAPAAVCLASCLGLLVSFSGFKVLNLGPVFGIWFEHIWIWSTSLSSLEHFNMVSLENETLWSSGKCNISLEFWVDMLAAPCF